MLLSKTSEFQIQLDKHIVEIRPEIVKGVQEKLLFLQISLPLLVSNRLLLLVKDDCTHCTHQRKAQGAEIVCEKKFNKTPCSNLGGKM